MGWLRRMCPCASCKIVREGRDPHQLMRPMTPDEARAAGKSPPTPDAVAPTAPRPAKSLSLSVLPRNFVADEQPVTVASAQKVGNYALRLVFTDGHDSGIFSFAYLRELHDRGDAPALGQEGRP